MKDNFSSISLQYAKYRPQYPSELAAFIQSQGAFKHAWDCGTGNGQMATLLAEFVPCITATDLSAEQLLQARQNPHIRYLQASAESSGLADQSVDLITIAQAIHWFDFERFYDEVRRVSKPGGLLLALGYGLISINPELDAHILHFYSEIVGPYWDAERRHIDAEYRSIPFPFSEKKFPDIGIARQWSLQDLAGYLGTWSAVKHYRDSKGQDPVLPFISTLQPHWPEDAVLTVHFRLFGRVGIVS